MTEERQKIYYWSELHESHLRRGIDRLMLDDGGKLEIVNCILKGDSPRSAIAPEDRRVIFDKDFVVYRVIRLLGALEWYEVKKILSDFTKNLKGGESVTNMMKELTSPSSESNLSDSSPEPLQVQEIKDINDKGDKKKG